MATRNKKDRSNAIDFPHFDILSGNSAYSDHHFNTSNKSKKAQDCFSNQSSAVSRKIAKEWKSLKKDLPESIYVRVYEGRIDLIRTVIIGNAETPYHDGLFFFDIVLPSDYPNHPPKVHYHAHGLRLNPNLYSSGYVCLSLIRTWSGHGVELWIPDKSTILQLLVSLQGLVLNDKPYFNEPGYEVGLKKMDQSWMKKSMAYNEEVFILSCKTMLYKVQTPPKGFESFVSEHFRSSGDFILAAVKAYRNGDAIVGQYKEVGSSVSSSSSVAISSKFKSKLEKIHLDLKLAFLKVDTYPPKMKNSIEFQSQKEEFGELQQPTSVGKSEKQGLSGMIVKVIKRIFE